MKGTIGALLCACALALQPATSPLMNPEDPGFRAPAPAAFHVRLDTTRGPLRLEIRREWSPHGVDRFFNLVRAGYYDDSAIFRVRPGVFAQFGINGTPAIARAWRSAAIPDDSRVLSNVRGTVAFAFAVPNGRTTQVFINLRDNSAADDPEPFVPFARIVEGMAAADAFYSGYGEQAGGGIRAGRQDPVFEGGNAFFKANFPKLDYIVKASIAK